MKNLAPVRAALLVVASVVIAVACGAAPPLVERFENGAWLAQPFEEVTRTGRRDGGDVEFEVVLQGPTRLTLEGIVRVDPAAALLAGSWSETGGAIERGGNVTAQSVDFLGGQGGRASIGGRLTLATRDGKQVYRVNLPTAPLQP